MSLGYPSTSQDRANIPNHSESGTGTKGQQWGTPIAPTLETEGKIEALQTHLMATRGGRWPKTLLLSMGIEALAREVHSANLGQVCHPVNTSPLPATIGA